MKNFYAPFFLILVFNSGHAFCQAPPWDWAKTAATTANAHDVANSVTTDIAGNIYVAGTFYSPTISFDTVVLTNTSVNFKADIFIVKYTPTGSVVWARKAGGTDNDYGMSCSVDGVGNVFVAGYYTSPVFSAGGFSFNNAGAEDIYTVQFNSSGSVNWAKSFGGIATDIAFSVGSDNSGNAYVAGYYESSSFSFDNQPMNNTGGADFYVVKLGLGGGTAQWVTSAAGIGDDIAYGLDVDAAGNVYVGGYFNSFQLIFGASFLGNAGGYDLFLAKYDENGNMLWVNGHGDSGSDVSRSVAAGGSNVYLTGYYGSPTLTFGTTTLTTGGGTDFFLASYDTSGTPLWAKGGGAAYGEEGLGVAADPFGNVYLAGSFESPAITIGTTTLTSGGNFVEDALFASYDNSGNVLWAKSSGGGDVDLANAICTDNAANVIAAGFFGSSSITFDGITLNNTAGAPYQDLYVAKLSTSVNVEENKTSGELNLFPNPASDELFVSSEQLEIFEIQIYDLLGSKKMNCRFPGQLQLINVAGLSGGFYILQAKTSNGVVVKKFLKN